MEKHWNRSFCAIVSIACILLVAALCAGCTSTMSEAKTPVTLVVTPSEPVPVTSTGQRVTPGMTTVQTVVRTTATPAPVYTYSDASLVVYTAASLKGVSGKLGTEFSRMYPGYTAVFNLDGTQALKTQVENGAYADVFISASNTYTNQLKAAGYFTDGSVKPLTSNYVIVILPASNPGNIRSLADLATPGKKIAIAAYNVPIGTVSYTALANLAKSTYGQDWNKSVFSNVVSYETSEPAVATKVSLGEVDAGLVYESTYATAPAGTLTALSIPPKDNVLQTYTIGVMKQTKNTGAAQAFEDFMLSSLGQQILKDYGFRPVS